MATAIICTFLVIICIFGIKSYLKKLSHGCCGSDGDTEKRIRPSDQDKSHYQYLYKVRIDGMTCQNCAVRIENAFHEKDGFLAKVNLQQSEAVVRTKEAVSEEELRKVIRDRGYSVRSLEATDSLSKLSR